MALAHLAHAALSLVLPPRCPGCGAIVGEPHSFCAGCFGDLSFLTPPWCATCGEPFATPHPPGTSCYRCQQSPPAYLAARAAFAYAEPAKGVVLALKHADATGHAATMAAQMARVGAGWFDPQARLVPVPLHRWRLWRRGFNQAALIAIKLARRTATPLVIDALVRTRATAPSGGMRRAERIDNVAGAFACPRPERVAGRAIVLVDDVMTSGATADACAAVLLEAGAASVRLLAFAKVVRAGDGAHY